MQPSHFKLWRALNWPNRISLTRLLLVWPFIVLLLNQTDWQKSRAAQILGIDNSTLYRKINKYKFASPRPPRDQGQSQ